MPRRLSRVQSDPLLREGRTNTQSDTPIIILVPTSVPLSFKARGVFVVGGTTTRTKTVGGNEWTLDGSLPGSIWMSMTSLLLFARIYKKKKRAFFEFFHLFFERIPILFFYFFFPFWNTRAGDENETRRGIKLVCKIARGIKRVENIYVVKKKKKITLVDSWLRIKIKGLAEFLFLWRVWSTTVFLQINFFLAQRPTKKRKRGKSIK